MSNTTNQKNKKINSAWTVVLAIAVIVAVLYIIKIIFDNNSVLSANFFYHYTSQLIELAVPVMLVCLLSIDANSIRRIDAELQMGMQIIVYVYATLVIIDAVFHQSLNGIIVFDVLIFYLIINNCKKKQVDGIFRVFVWALIVTEILSLLLTANIIRDHGILSSNLRSFIVELLFLFLLIVRKIYDRNRYIFLAIIYILQFSTIGVLFLGLLNEKSNFITIDKLNNSESFYILSATDSSMALTATKDGLSFEKFTHSLDQRFYVKENVSVEDKESYGIVNKKTGLFCDVKSAFFEEFTPVVSWQENDLVQQIWHIYKAHDNTWVITSYNEEFMLSYNPWFPAESVIISRYNEMFQQQFYFVNTYENNRISGYVSDGSGARTIIIYIIFVVLLLAYQMFKFVKNNKNTVG